MQRPTRDHPTGGRSRPALVPQHGRARSGPRPGLDRGGDRVRLHDLASQVPHSERSGRAVGVAGSEHSQPSTVHVAALERPRGFGERRSRGNKHVAHHPLAPRVRQPLVAGKEHVPVVEELAGNGTAQGTPTAPPPNWCPYHSGRFPYDRPGEDRHSGTSNGNALGRDVGSGTGSSTTVDAAGAYGPAAAARPPRTTPRTGRELRH